MKITNLVMSLTLAGLCLNQASAQGIPHAMPSASRSIGDSSSDYRPAYFTSGRSLSDEGPSSAAQLDQQILVPTAAYQASAGDDQASHSSGDGYEYVPSGYSTAYRSNAWLNAESLLWFSKSVNSPALVNTSDFGVLPVNGVTGVQSAIGGGTGIDYGVIPGFRLSGGVYLDGDQKVGVSGRGYGIINASEKYSRTSDGSGNPANPSIGIPFYNLFNNGEDAFLVAYADGGGPDKAGTVKVRSDLDMYGADASLSFLLTRSDSMRMDLLGGYTYNILKNSIGVETLSTSFRFPNAGTVTATNDLFETKNVFNGGHLGVLSSVVRSRVSLSTLAKVAFGNMQQSGAIRGYSDVNGTPIAAGILTQPSNIGTFSRDTFAFIPELGIKLGFAARENVQLSIGYTMMMWSGVGLAGNQIDTAVDPTQLVLLGAGTRPTPLFQESSFWMQGIDFGVNFTY